MSKRRIHVIITGRVQGVYFRESTRRQAIACGIAGWICNTSDGKVEAIFEGNNDSIDQILAYVHQGPAQACVVDVSVSEEQYNGEFEAFNIVSIQTGDRDAR